MASYDNFQALDSDEQDQARLRLEGFEYEPLPGPFADSLGFTALSVGRLALERACCATKLPGTLGLAPRPVIQSVRS